MTALSPFDEVIRDFAAAQHLPRIKKLLVYACTQQWESDIDRLAHHNLHELITTLMQLAPTLDQLQTYLNQVTQTLSKSAEYLLIANTVVQHLRPLYVGPISSPNLQANSHLYWQIAQTLEQEAECLRIRKLLVLVCRNYWESDRDRLLAIDLPEVLLELHQLTQNLENLRAVISSVVQTTSKPAQYQAIANRIIHACQPLYMPDVPEETELRSMADGTASYSTHVHPTDPTQHEPMTGSRHAEYLSIVAASPDQGSMNGHTSGREDEAMGDRRLFAQPIPAFSKAELYDLRLEMMKYAVPLLAKHLLFLIVYTPPGQASEEEQAEFAVDPDAWMSLKNRDLDDLIEAALKFYPTLDHLNAALQLTVRSLPNAQRYLPVATAIVRAVRTLMTKSTFARAELLNAPPHQPTKQQHPGDAPSDDHEGTRQVFASTVTFQEQPVASAQGGNIHASASSQQSAGGGDGAIAATLSSQPSPPASSSAETACLPPPNAPQQPPDRAPNQHHRDGQADHTAKQTQHSQTQHSQTQHSQGPREPIGTHDANPSNSTDETAFLT